MFAGACDEEDASPPRSSRDWFLGVKLGRRSIPLSEDLAAFCERERAVPAAKCPIVAFTMSNALAVFDFALIDSHGVILGTRWRPFPGPGLSGGGIAGNRYLHSHRRIASAMGL